MENAQISFFELAFEKKCSEATSKLQAGDTVYMAIYDVIKQATVIEKWLVKGDIEEPYFGYRLKFEKPYVGHDCVWDKNVGDDVFTDIDEAKALAHKNALTVNKICFDEMMLSDARCFEYIRDSDNYMLKASIAKTCDCGLYEHDFYCYHFLKYFKSEKERDKEYARLLKKIEKECNENSGKMMDLDSSRFETMYKVSDVLYASFEYAKRNAVANKKD